MSMERESRPTAITLMGQDRNAPNRSNLHHDLVADLSMRAARWERLGDLQRAVNLRRLALAMMENATR